jgi:hypothetical protein
MLYKAVVVDNTKFYSHGILLCRVEGMFLRNFDWDLSTDYPESIELGNENPEQIGLVKCILSSPSGGGDNFGLLILPQINEKGLVAFLDNNRTKGVWIKSIFEPKYPKTTKPDGSIEVDRTEDIEKVNIPNNDDNTEEDGSISGESKQKTDPLKTNLIYRTKTTNKDSAEGVDFKENYTTNIVSIGEEGMEISHYSEDDWDNGSSIGRKKIMLDDTQISLTFNKEDIEHKMTLSEEGLKVNITDGSQTNEIIFDFTDGFTIKLPDQTFNVEGKEMNINVEKAIISGLAEIGESLKVKGGKDGLVLYEKMKMIVEVLENHKHIAPSGPTVGPPLDSTMAPLMSKTTSPKLQMKTTSITGE